MTHVRAAMSDRPSTEHVLGSYHFEGGGYMMIVKSCNVPTEKALEMADLLLEIKRKELAIKNE